MAEEDGTGHPPAPSGTPEEEQVAEALAQVQSAMRGVSGRGLAKLLLVGLLGRLFRFRRLGGTGIRRLRKRLVFFLIGVVIVALSVTTCSAGVDPASLTSEYGDPVPASREAAVRLVQKAGAALNNLPASRSLRLTVTQAEATSALSLGMMVPELMRAMETLAPGELHGIDDIGQLRETLRAREEALEEDSSFRHRMLALLDPKLRTGDTQVRFLSSGEIATAGYVQAWRWQQPYLVVVAPHARGGELSLDFVKGRLGRLPAPEWAFDRLGALLSSLILLGQEYVEISELSVAGGRMTFAARVAG